MRRGFICAERPQQVSYGLDTGKCYRIRHGYQMNVEELGQNGRRIKLLCFMPIGGLPVGDIMLAQKIRGHHVPRGARAVRLPLRDGCTPRRSLTKRPRLAHLTQRR